MYKDPKIRSAHSALRGSEVIEPSLPLWDKEAARLRKALASMNVDVNLEQARHLIAQSKGFEDWQALNGERSKGVTDACHSEQWLWLRWLESELRMVAVTPEELSDLAVETHCPSEAKTINSQGMSAQLQARLCHLLGLGQSWKQARQNMLADLSDLLCLNVSEPGRPDTPKSIPLYVNLKHAQSSRARTETIDMLPWVAQSTASVIQDILQDTENRSLRLLNCLQWLGAQTVFSDLQKEAIELLKKLDLRQKGNSEDFMLEIIPETLTQFMRQASCLNVELERKTAISA